MCGVEYFAHPWEFGPRKAKELLLTGDAIDADEAHALGMVTKVFPADDLADRTVEFAQRIAQLPTMSALLIKEAVNQSRRQHGLLQRPQRLLHAPRAEPLALGPGERRRLPDRQGGAGIPNWKEAPPIVPAVKDKVRADQ